MKCYYHNDADGRCAGAIVFLSLENQKDDGYGIDFIEVDYKDKIDVSAIKPNERIIIVDFSFTLEVMDMVLGVTKDVTWIDHHKTAEHYKYGCEIKGIRDFSNKGDAGCELAWRYFRGTEKMPDAVKLIGDRDSWNWQYGTRTAEFNEGLKLYPHCPTDRIWEELLNSNTGESHVDFICNKGETCLSYRDSFCNDYLKSFGFETKFEGYKCLVLGLYHFGSEAFGKKFKEYDICISFGFDGEKYSVGLYSEKVDVGEIAKKYGGGGHKGAAGFISKEFLFNREINNT